MKRQTYLLSKMKERGWEDREIDYARNVMMSAQNERSNWRIFFDSAILWIFLILIAIGNLIVISLIMPLFVLFPNAAIYGILILLGASFGFLVQIILHDVEYLFSGHHTYIMYILIPFIAASGGLMILSYAQTHLPDFFFFDRSPLKMSILYTIFFILPLAVAKMSKKKVALQTATGKKEVL